MTIKVIQILKKAIERIVPTSKHLLIRLFWYKISGKLDDEIIYVDKILKKKRRFLDIGTNVGIYSYYFSKKFSKIESFEPLKEITHRLKALNNKNIKIHHLGLSNRNGNLEFYIPIKNKKMIPPLATLEKRNKPYKIRTIDVKCLDEFNFKDVDFIKIDVEGHEYNVILGALKTIKQNQPAIVCEIEQRHTTVPINKIFRLMKKIKYQGYFFKNLKLNPLKNFSYEADQKPYLNDVENKKYVNNFIFLPILSKYKI